MKILELFAGTRSISKEFEKCGHEVFTIEFDEQHKDIDWYTDIMNVKASDIIEKFGYPDVIWASPPCTKFSVASIGRHWDKETRKPKNKETEDALNLLIHTIELIKELNPKYFFIENPRGMMRKMDCLQEFDRHTVTYCQYGDTRMKPTDIWTNHPNPKFKPACKNGNPCHVSAPRGSRTGTQGIKNVIDRSRIPKELCEHISIISGENMFEYIAEYIIEKVSRGTLSGFQSIIEFSDIYDKFKIKLDSDMLDEFIDYLNNRDEFADIIIEENSLDIVLYTDYCK